ncbi:MAG: hypothetical protein GXN93_03230 [Candidatus Diapherotrites archaeon]|nr:hypothetical protein [Candidatus Diapherotrites archaeon]
MSQTDPKHQNHWQLILLLLAAFGVPVAAVTTQFERITTNPWLALALFVVWELIVLVIGFVTDVWGRLREIWSERAAKWIDRRVIALLSRYRKKYEKHLMYRHRDFDVKGLGTQGPYTLELEKVFVELRLQPQAPHKASVDPVRKPPKELQEGRHVIWDFLTSPHLLILEREQGIYGFAHLTFQEYLASVHAIENQLLDKLTAHIEDSWWHETLRLYAAQTDATPVLEACLQDDPPAVAALALALEVEPEEIKSRA